jgi:alanyl-tRNA synthetase
MEPTERLYFKDSSLLEFSATVTGTIDRDGDEHVVLDRTAFYPTGGGQPNDTGRLNEVPVLDVIEEESGLILHKISNPKSFAIGSTVWGFIDRERRLDHMQQHSGQHILSQAFVQACGAQTRSFHLGSQTSTIDIEIASPGEADIRAAEEIANTVVFEDREMRVHIVNEDEAANLPLRKESAVKGTIRVIEVVDFDWSPCGGTHAARAGQVGLIAVKSWERSKKMTRVEFVCGRRALLDYRLANTIGVEVARMFSADRNSAAELVDRTLKENKAIKKRIRELLELAMTGEASKLLSTAESVQDFKLVRVLFKERDAEELRVLGSKIVESEPAVAILGGTDAGTARLVFASSKGLSQNVGELMTEACSIVGGRGGGRPEFAQGGGPNTEKIAEALECAYTRVKAG